MNFQDPKSNKIKLWFGFFSTFFKRKSIQIKKQKKRFFFLVFPLLLILGFLIWQGQNTTPRQKFTEGIVGTYTQDNLPTLVTNLLTGSLIKMDETGTPKGDIADSWEVNPEATLYKIRLKKDIYWLDGTPVKASDMDLSMPGVEFSVIDDETIQFKLPDSYSPFLSLLEKPVFKKGTTIGTGPYKVTKIKKDQIFVSRLSLSSKNLDLPDLIIKFFDSERTAKNAFMLGEVDGVLGLNDLSELKKQKTVKIWSKTNYQQLVTIFYNTQDSVLSDENMRLALSFAAPSIEGEAEAKTSIPSTSWAFNPQVKDYLNNDAQAKSYWNKVQNGKDSTVTLTATSFLRTVGEKVVEEWKRQGIKAVLRVESGIPQNFQALLITQNIPADPDQYSLWHSTQSQTNISKFESKRIDKDLEDGRKISDPKVRKERYDDFQRVLLDEAPATFLYFPKFTVAYRAKKEAELKKVIDLQI